MFTLHHHPFCPFSRTVRIAMGEYGMGAEFVEQRTWERRREFLEMNPANTLPVLLIGQAGRIVGLRPILEFLDETKGPSLGPRRMMPTDPYDKAEVRRLLDWFDDNFHGEVTQYLVREKIFKRFMRAEDGGGGPDTRLILAGTKNLKTHMAYISHLAVRRNWLGGDSFSYADVTAAAHLSCLDYLGDVPWDEYEQAKNWYARVKSRPSFRPLLVDQVPGMRPAASYVDLDF
ncbi:glutathione S-transferase family protein [Tepidamorphus sp. 3E244]|uniref:glutathione S-transferase family protein n=1 Tax=Tepidamorphus sp. 3E244 TaxID=3385498 RepID=UPI0038FC1802